MELNEAREQVRQNIKWSTKKPQSLGGQQCGMPSYPVVLKSDELDLEITIGYHRSQMKNRDLALTLFESALIEIIK